MESIFLSNVELFAGPGPVANEVPATDPPPPFTPLLLVLDDAPLPVKPCTGLVSGAMFSYSSSLFQII